MRTLDEQISTNSFANVAIDSDSRQKISSHSLLQWLIAYLRQVDRNRRTVDQFCNTLSTDDSPILRRDAINRILQEFTAAGLLDHSAGVFQPASLGWRFIESTRIYSNIANEPIGATVVDADSGKTIATIANLSSEQGGVQIAGKSYEVLQTGTTNRLLVRSGGDSALSPRYHSRSLPYCFDIGAALQGLLVESPGTIYLIREGDGCAVFTWLGMLFNSAIVAGLSRLGIIARAKSFQISAAIVDAASIVLNLQRAIQSIGELNPMSSLDIERLVDLGPHFDKLTPDTQKLAKDDWLDTRFLEGWANSLKKAVEVPLDSALGKDLISLA